MQASPGDPSATLQNCDRASSENFLTYAQTYSLSGYDLASASSPLLKQGGCLQDVIARVGPHFTLRSATLSAAVVPAAGLQLTLQIENTGWARLSRHRTLYLWLMPQGGSPVLHPIDVDLSSLEPQSKATWTVVVPVTLAPDRYTAALAAPDPPERLRRRADYALLFESIDVADVASGVSVIGRFAMPPA